MNFLFIHDNFPGQFRHLISTLGNNERHNVIFLTAAEDAETGMIKGVQVMRYRMHRQINNQIHHYLVATEEAVIKGQSIARAVYELQEKGFTPNFVIWHAGMGLGMFLSEVCSNATKIGYFEWYFRKETTRYLVETIDADTVFRSSARNLPINQELLTADYAVVPTHWQKKQFPKEYREKLRVIFDGIDTNFFHEKVLTNEQEVEIADRETGEKYRLESNSKIVSYATRGMEPLRGFPEFMGALPGILGSDKNIKVVIAGKDKQAYSYPAPNTTGSWKSYCLNKLGEFKGRENIIFTGLLTYEDYRKLLWRTDAHCYFTKPYVTSWSLFEAGCCGTPLIVNESDAVTDIFEEETVQWIKELNSENIASKVKEVLGKKVSPRSKIRKGFELSVSFGKWENLLKEALEI